MPSAVVTFTTRGKLAAFQAPLAKFKKRINEGGEALLKEVYVGLYDAVQTGDAGVGTPGTPFDTHYAQACWNMQPHSPPEQEPPITYENAKRGKPVAGLQAIKTARRRAIENISRATMGDVVFISNTAPYIVRLEFGSSQQAPQGFIRLALSNFGRIVANAARRAGR